MKPSFAGKMSRVALLEVDVNGEELFVVDKVQPPFSSPPPSSSLLLSAMDQGLSLLCSALL
jgi:hypothetical protein